LAGLVPAIHELRLAWVIMGRRDKPGDDEKGKAQTYCAAIITPPW
jgi:hypothetical protein